uniref:Helicase ATP-binding domain-containing protein n=1 Tax=Panagrolaimus davidi TaxID=227884 RepID=A0A914PHK5_9BILA
MGNSHSSTPKLTKNSALHSPPITPIPSFCGNNPSKNKIVDAINATPIKNNNFAFIKEEKKGNEIVEDSLLLEEDKENDGRISRERSLVGTPISKNKLKNANIFTPQTQKDRQRRIERKHSDLSNSSMPAIEGEEVMPMALYESDDSDCIIKRKPKKRIIIKDFNETPSIIIDSEEESDSDATLDEEDDIIKSEDDEEEKELDNSFIVDDLEDGNFIESNGNSSSDESFVPENDQSIVIDEVITEASPPKRRINPPRRRKTKFHHLNGTGSNQGDPITILPSQDESIAPITVDSEEEKSDSSATLDEEDDILKSEDEEEESDNSFIVDDEEVGNNFIESQKQQSEGSSSDESFVPYENINESMPKSRLPALRRKRGNPHVSRRSRRRKANPQCLKGTGSNQDPITILPSPDDSIPPIIISSEEESDSSATLDEEDDIMESEEEEGTDNSFIEDDMNETRIQINSSDESFECDESIAIDESIVKPVPHLRNRRKKAVTTNGAGSNRNPIVISAFEEDKPCSSKSLRRQKAKNSAIANDISCITIEDSDNENTNAYTKTWSTLHNNNRSNTNSANSSMPDIIELDSFNSNEKRLYGGKMSDKRKEKIAAVTEEVIQQIHGSLDSMPENVITETPEDLTIDLMLHQKHGLTWMKWRENQKLNRGGILADDMGLGKTLSMISLIVSQKCDRKNSDEVKQKLKADMEKHFSSEKNIYPGYCTLVVAPASVIYQWEKEIKDRVKTGKLKVYVFHGPQRERNPMRLASNDIVITTYNTISSELGDDKSLQSSGESDIDDFIVDDDKWYSKKKKGSKKVVNTYFNYFNQLHHN